MWLNEDVSVPMICLCVSIEKKRLKTQVSVQILDKLLKIKCEMEYDNKYCAQSVIMPKMCRGVSL